MSWKAPKMPTAATLTQLTSFTLKNRTAAQANYNLAEILKYYCAVMSKIAKGYLVISAHLAT